MAQTVKRLSAIMEIQVRSLGWEDPLEKEMTTHSSILAWEIPQRSLAGYSPWGPTESNTTERTHIYIWYREKKVKSFSSVQLFATMWTAAHQAPLSMGFSRKEYWSGLPCPPPVGSFRPRDQTRVSCFAGGFCTTEPLGRPSWTDNTIQSNMQI